MIRIGSIASIVIVEGEEFLLLATGIKEEAGQFARNTNKLENIKPNPTNDNFFFITLISANT